MTKWRDLGLRPKRLRENLALSPNEERYILAETMTGQVYTAPAALRLGGPVDWSRLEGFLQLICDRNEARRTGFEKSADGRFTKYIVDCSRVKVKRLSMPGATDAELRAAVREHVYQKGDFSPETLHRYMLIRIGPDDHVLAYGQHHATTDGVTGTSFILELLYRLLDLEFDETAPTQYSDYWDYDWQNSEAYAQAREFWLDRMAGLEAGGVLPPDRGVSGVPEARPGVKLEMPPEMVEATQKAAEALGVTHFTYFYAVYMVLLGRLTGTDRVCTTFQSNGRRGKEGAEKAHGVFSNALILGTRVDEAESIRTLAGRLKGEIREAIANEIFPYHHVIRATGVHPRFAINWYPPIKSQSIGEVTYTSIDLDENQDDDDINYRIYTINGRMAATMFYNPALLGPARAQSIGEQLLTLAAELAADVDRPIRETRSVDLAASGVLPDPAAPLPAGGGALIHTAFLARAGENPDATAIVHGAAAITYGELERRSRALAQALRAQGVAAGDRVAILADRTPGTIVAMLAAARAGVVFTVMDCAYPEPHLAGLVEIAAPHAILWAGEPDLASLAERLAQPAKAKVLAADAPVDGDASLEGLDAARPQDPAYILFTSGSTGHPKGVACNHLPLTHFLDWQAQTFGLTADDRFSQLSGLSHDPMLRDVFAPLSLGATLAIPDVSILEPGALPAWVAASRVSVIHLTPALGQLLLAGADLPLPHLRWVFWGGDMLRPQIAADLARLAPQAEQVNFYGSTETPQAAGYHRLDGDTEWAAVPVGAGSDGFQLIVVDADRNPVGVGELGEVAVRSNYLSLGYVERGRIVAPADRGQERKGGASLYFTGDRGFYLPDGAVMLVGRADDQVKIRGYRVELAEVAAALLARPQVRSAAAVAVGEGAQRKIVGFVAGTRRLDVDDLKASLAARLPAHMIPHTIRQLDTLPMLPNGKVNRQALIAQYEADSAGDPVPSAGPANAIERQLITAWGGLLGAKSISRESSFANLGGDSLSYVQAYLALEEVIGEPPSGWQLMSVAELASAPSGKVGGWTRIDAPIVIRAAAISLVVAGHLHLFRYGGGATTALFLVSGYLFGGLQLREVFSKDSAQPVLRWLMKLFIPTMLFSIVMFTVKTLGGKDENISTLLLTADLQDYSKLTGPYWGGHEFYLWFIHCQLQMLAMIYLAVLAMVSFGGKKWDPWRFSVGLFLAGCVGRFVFPFVVYPDLLLHASHTRSGFSQLSFLPTTHLATLALGTMVATAETRAQKLWVGAALVVYGLSSAFYGPGEALILAACGAGLMAASHAALPRPVATTVMSIAGASLFIYLTHFLTQSTLRAAHAPEWPLLQVVAAMIVGIGIWRLWSLGAGLLVKLVRRPNAAEALVAPI